MTATREADKLTWIGRAVTVLAVVPFAMSAFLKLWPNPDYGQQLAHLGLSENLMLTLAILELLCIVLYLIPQTSILGAILFTGYLGGAISIHLRVGDPVYIQAALGGLVWLGIYLREPRLRNILPLRN